MSNSLVLWACAQIQLNSRLGKVYMNPIILGLITQYQIEKNEETLVTLWEHFQPLVINLSRKFHVLPDNQEDVSQDAFLLLFECAKLYDPDQGVAFEAYYKIKLNYWFLNRMRRTTELLVVDQDWPSGLSLSNLIESTIGNAQERLVGRETCEELELALEALTARQRQAVVLFYLYELPLAEVASRMGCSYHVAYKHKSAGLKNMRARIGVITK